MCVCVFLAYVPVRRCVSPGLYMSVLPACGAHVDQHLLIRKALGRCRFGVMSVRSITA